MALKKFDGFTFNHVDQPDTPSMTPEQTKQSFDSRGAELKDFLNALVDTLNSTKDGESGADNIAATGIDGVAGATVQAILGALKARQDNTTLDGISAPGANIELVGGTGIEITPNSEQKKITFEATGAFNPAHHAESHAIGGADALTPEDIGAAKDSEFKAHLAKTAKEQDYGSITSSPDSTDDYGLIA